MPSAALPVTIIMSLAAADVGREDVICEVIGRREELCASYPLT